MLELIPSQFPLVRLFFDPYVDHFTCAYAVLGNNAPGQVWVDDLDHPQVGLIDTWEGHHLFGDPACQASYPGLRAALPINAYLVCQPSAWAEVRSQFWNDSIARIHPRCHYRWRGPQWSGWRAALPVGYEFVAIHEEGQNIPALMEHSEVTDRLNGWFTPQACFAEGAGYAFLQQGRVVTVCMSDCTLGERIEIGIWTDPAYRRRGLAAMATAATVEACLAKGYTHIGWQCLANNIGSRSVAHKVGFQLDCEYIALSSSLPTENPGDLSPAECEDWALHYESAPPEDGRSCYRAAATRALAGQPELALQHLRRLLTLTWRGNCEWFGEDFRFDSLRQLPEFQSLVAQFRTDLENK
jgi:RimJ/RimL family protein N-acetyltransferase